jgi:hypothetical protein
MLVKGVNVFGSPHLLQSFHMMFGNKLGLICVIFCSSPQDINACLYILYNVIENHDGFVAKSSDRISSFDLVLNEWSSILPEKTVIFGDMQHVGC